MNYLVPATGYHAVDTISRVTVQRALVNAGIYVTSGVVSAVLRDLTKAGLTSSQGGGRRQSQKGLLGRDDEPAAFLDDQIAREKAHVASIQNRFNRLKSGNYTYRSFGKKDPIAVPVGGRQYNITKSQLEAEAKASNARLKALESQRSTRHFGGSVVDSQAKSNKGQPGSKEWRRFARDFRRRSRLGRYARQSSASRFKARFKGGFRR